MDKIVVGLNLTVVGLGTVFLVLFLLQITMNAESWFFNKWLPKRTNTNLKTPAEMSDFKKASSSHETTLPVSALGCSRGYPQVENLSPELVATIMGAITSYTGQSSRTFRLVSVRKTWDREASSPWSFQGRTDLINSRANFYAKGGTK